MKSVAERGPRRVESRQNARIKELRAALARGTKTPHVAIEGLHLVQEALKSGLTLHTVFVRNGSEALLEHLTVGDAEVLIVAEEVFASATMTEHPQGIAALVEAPEFPLQATFTGTPGKPRHPGAFRGGLRRNRHDAASRDRKSLEREDVTRVVRVRLPAAGSGPYRRRCLCRTPGAEDTDIRRRGAGWREPGRLARAQCPAGG
jgi:hypothetical protein